MVTAVYIIFFIFILLSFLFFLLFLFLSGSCKSQAILGGLVLIISKLLIVAWDWENIYVLAWSYGCALDLRGIKSLVVEEELTAFAYEFLAVFLIDFVLNIICRHRLVVERKRLRLRALLTRLSSSTALFGLLSFKHSAAI